MKILLIGEYSNVHWTLAEGLRSLGHDVTVISDGDDWKNYKRDISIRRYSIGKIDSIRYAFSIMKILPKLTNFDIVQIINPIFFELKPKKLFYIYRFLRKYNKKIFLGAFGMDHYYVKTALDCQTFRYSDFNIGKNIRENENNSRFIEDWINGDKGSFNTYIANDCDGIISGLYEYYVSYIKEFKNKTTFIPFPIDIKSLKQSDTKERNKKIRFFIGIQHKRHSYKGTDILYNALIKLANNYPNKVEIVKAESVPFEEYKDLMNTSDVLLDQLYSYTPAMNALLAMSKGIVVVGGGEEEHYNLLNEKELRPIINVLPNEDDVYNKLVSIINNPDMLNSMALQSKLYIRKHHDHIEVASKYINFWNL